MHKNIKMLYRPNLGKQLYMTKSYPILVREIRQVVISFKEEGTGAEGAEN